MARQAKQNVGRGHRIGKLSSDNGYFSEENVDWAERKLDVYIATGRIKHGEKVPGCPRGRPSNGLTVKERMARKLRTKKGRETYAQRKWIVEPIFGYHARLGVHPVPAQRHREMRGEWRLVCMACNLRKLWSAG